MSALHLLIEITECLQGVFKHQFLVHLPQLISGSGIVCLYLQDPVKYFFQLFFGLIGIHLVSQRNADIIIPLLDVYKRQWLSILFLLYYPSIIRTAYLEINKNIMKRL